MYYLPFHRVRKGFLVIQENEVKEAIQDHKVTKDQQEMLVWKDRLYVITAFDAKQLLQELPTWNKWGCLPLLQGEDGDQGLMGFQGFPGPKVCVHSFLLDLKIKIYRLKIFTEWKY